MNAVSNTILQTSSKLELNDYLDAVKLRWTIGRNSSAVKPGIYSIGTPDSSSDVFVSANYKLSFDHLRKSLQGINAWILVIDTKGVNVWCAAGKGTFGTDEIVKRIKVHNLSEIVEHKKIIVPQLGATGVAAHLVKQETGFRVLYGPVLAKDIKEFIGAGYKASPQMRRVTFPLWERLKLIPAEICYGGKYIFLVPSLFIILGGLNRNGYSVDLAFSEGVRAAIILLFTCFSTAILTPALLPFLPFRRFSLKGIILGAFIFALIYFKGFAGTLLIEKASWFFMVFSLSSFLAMNFTGASTFTSLSGVTKEMKTALPAQIIGAAVGLILWIVSRFF